jgi:hypothetical protein
MISLFIAQYFYLLDKADRCDHHSAISAIGYLNKLVNEID